MLMACTWCQRPIQINTAAVKITTRGSRLKGRAIGLERRFVRLDSASARLMVNEGSVSEARTKGSVALCVQDMG